MQGLIYSELNIFCIVILGMIFYRVITGVDKQIVQRKFAELIITAIFFLIVGNFWGLFQIGIINPPVAIAKIIDMLYYSSIALFSYFWFCYSETVQQSDLLNPEHRIKRWFPLAILGILIVLSGSLGLIFDIDDNLNDSLGPLYFVQIILTYGYIIFTSLKAALFSAKKENYARREKMYMLALFSVPVIAAGIIQIFIPQLPILSAGITISLIIIYINSINQLILIDPLTQLNNRNQLMKYLSAKIKNDNPDMNLFLLIMDADNFKKINDEYGHVEGDRALVTISQALKMTCKSHDYFVSRFGGDEFVAVYETAQGKPEVEHLCRDIKDTLAQLNEELELPYNLTLSIGYTEYSKIVGSIPEFIAMADVELYKAKQKKSMNPPSRQ